MKSLSLSQPHLIVMVGIPGSGKTFFAEKFAQTFRTPYVSHAVNLSFTGDDDTAYDIALYQLGELLKTQQSILVEGVAETRTERAELAKKARKAGYETLFVWVQTDPVTAKNRLTKGKTAVMSAEEYDHQVKRFTPPSAVEHPVVISGKHTYATQAKVILKKLSAPRAEISVHTTPLTRPASQTRRNITIR